MSNYDLWLLPQDGPEMLDESQTECRGWYAETDKDDAYTCDARTDCYMCGGVVCSEHDETDDCDGYVVHEGCHRQGCMSSACEADRRDDALLER